MKKICEIELSLKQLIIPGFLSFSPFFMGFTLMFRFGFRHGIFPVAIGALILAPFVLHYLNTDLILFENKIFGKTGVINTKTINVPLNKVNGISVEQGLFGKLLGYKTITVSTSSNIVSFKKVVNADYFAEKALDQVEDFKRAEKKKEVEMLAKAIKS